MRGKLDARRGALAQLGERLPCTQEVTGSIPVGSTNTQRQEVTGSSEASHRPVGSTIIPDSPRVLSHAQGAWSSLRAPALMLFNNVE